jgi:hypothetical protein
LEEEDRMQEMRPGGEWGMVQQKAKHIRPLKGVRFSKNVFLDMLGEMDLDMR